MTDSDDWRVTVSLAGQAQTEQAQQALSQHEVEEDVRRQLGRTIAVGAGDSQIFLYAGTEIAAREAEQAARGDLRLTVELALKLKDLPRLSAAAGADRPNGRPE